MAVWLGGWEARQAQQLGLAGVKTQMIQIQVAQVVQQEELVQAEQHAVVWEVWR